MRPLAVLALVGSSFVVSVCAASAATEVTLLVDGDHSDATGCTVTTADGAFAGVDWRYVATIEGNDASQAQVTSYTVAACVNPGFGPTSVVPGPVAAPWNVGLGAGTGGTDVVEAWVPTGALGQTVQLGFVATVDGAAPGEDALLTTDGTGPTSGQPILLHLRSILEIPTLGEWGLLLLAALLALAAAAALRRRRTTGTVIAATLLLAGSAGIAWAAIVPDGNPAD